MKPVRILIADDQVLVRSGIRVLLEGIDDVQVIAEAGDGLEALRLVAEHAPDILVLDISMPGLNGFDVLAQMGQKFPEVRAIILTVHDSEEYVMRALSLGAMGYLTKSGASAELDLAIKTVARKKRYVSVELAKRIFLEHGTDAGRRRGPLAELTPRQLQVLRMIVDGHAAKGIALELDISPKTVETYRAQLMERLNIHDVAGLVRFAFKMGLIDVE